MLEAKLFWFAVAGALVVGVIAYALRRGDVGHGRFFADQSYHFQTLRVLNDVPSDGADTTEVLETVKHVRSGDAQGWFRAWSGTGDLGRSPGGSNHRSDRQGPRAAVRTQLLSHRGKACSLYGFSRKSIAPAFIARTAV